MEKIIIFLVILGVGLILGVYIASQIEKRIDKKFKITKKDREKHQSMNDDFYDFYE